MIGVLDELPLLVGRARLSASKDAEAALTVRAELNDIISFVAAFERMEHFNDFKENGKTDGENDVSFIHDRVIRQAAKDAEEGRWQLVRFKVPHGEHKCGDIVEVPKTMAEWQERLGEVVMVSEEQAAKWWDEQHDQCAVPSVGDSLRVASLLHGA